MIQFLQSKKGGILAKWSPYYSQILKVLAQKKSTTYKDLSKTVYTSPTYLKRLVSTLQKKGIVQLSNDGMIELSSNGKWMFEFS